MTTPDHLSSPEPKEPDHLTDPAAGWRSNLKSQELEAKAFQPEALVQDLWSSVQEGPGPIENLTDPVEGRMREAGQAYARQVEDTFLKHRGVVPMEWLLSQDPDDLALLDVEAGPYLRAAAAHRKEYERRIARQEQELDRLVQERIAGAERGRRLLEILPGGLGRMAESILAPEDEPTRVELEEATRQRIEEELARGNAEQDTFLSAAMEFFGTAISPAFDLIDALDPVRGLTRTVFGETAAQTVDAWRAQNLEEEYEERKAEVAARFGSEEDLRKVGREFVSSQAYDQWVELRETDPQEFQDLVEMGMGDEARAFGLFAASVEEQLPEPDEQLVRLGEQIRDGVIQVLEENDFSAAAEVMDVLSWYGEKVMAVPTTLSLLLTDEDLQSSAFRGEVSKLWEAVEANDYSPAEALGIGGTAVGLGLDIGAGIIFDPMTWIFGPNAGLTNQRARTAAEIGIEMSSVGVRRTVDDMIRLVNEGDLAAAASVGRFLDDVGELDNLWIMAQAGELTDDGVREVVERALMEGATAPNARRLGVNAAWASRVQEAIRSEGVAGAIRRYGGQYRTTRRFGFFEPGEFGRMVDAAHSLWGTNREKANQWVGRLMEARQRIAGRAVDRVRDARYVRAQQLDEGIEAARDMLGGGWDDASRHLDDAAQANQAQLQTTLTDMVAERDRLYLELLEEYGEVGSYQELADEVLGMWDDYNRTVLAEMDEWKPFVNKDGIVPWDVLRGGEPTAKQATVETVREFFPKEVIEQVGEDTAEKMIQQLSHTLNTVQGVNTPISVLDLVIASQMGGARYARALQHRTMQAVRESAWSFHRLWVIDKVFRPATAATVSFDELSRIFHRYGHKAAERYLQDKVVGLANRAARVLGKGNKLPARIQNRIKRLSEYPTQFKQVERQTLEGWGQGWDTIMPGEPGYRDAARRWTGDLLQDEGFRAFMEGEDSFRTFWNSGAGVSSRSRMVLDGEGARLMTAEEAYQGWQTVWELIEASARDAGKFGDVRRAFLETAREISSSGGVVRELPDFVFDALGPVRGVRKVAPQGGASAGVLSVQEWFFDKFFMEPTNYRRGFIHDLAYNTERERLLSLFADQGKRIVPDDELARILGLPDAASARALLGSQMDAMASKMGLVTEGRLNKLAENVAADEIDNMMYAWDSASRAGKQSKIVFPFGGPWADMWAFWGREMMTRPLLRGWINNASFMNIGGIAKQTVNRLPFNPRVPSMMSRLAATDFSLDRGWWPDGEQNEGLLPGSESTDLSPLFFLPTGGENPFWSIIPGLGPVPTFLADLVITQKWDPIEDADEYARALEAISQIVPGMAYTKGGILADLIGGGTLGAAVGLSTDASAWFTGRGNYVLESYIGDISTDINRARELSALLADPAELEDLLALDDEEDIELALVALAEEATRRAAAAHAGEKVARLAVPARSDYDTALDQIHDVWLEAGQMFDDLAVRRELGGDIEDPELRRQVSADVRRTFFELPQWKRDLFISQYPQIAVNLVSSWEWTRRAENELSREAQTPYRTSGSEEDLARHEQYIRQGYIRPVEPQTRAYRILGLIQASQRRAAQDIYTFTAEQVNDAIWESRVTDSTKQYLQNIVESEWGPMFGVETARELWEKWSRAEDELERYIALVTGADPDDERIKEAVSIPSKQRGWGTTWPGLDEEELSQRFSEVTFSTFRPEVEELANGLGIDLTAGMSGLQLFTGVQEAITEASGPLWDIVGGSYQAYLGERTANATAAMNKLRDRTNNPNLDPIWRNELRLFMERANNLEERIRERSATARAGRAAADVLPSEAEQIKNDFLRLAAVEPDEAAWNSLWEAAFERTYGPLDWEPPAPPELFDENGDLRSTAYAPYILDVHDGDTITVRPYDTGFGGNAGPSGTRRVRLLGVNARELNQDGGLDDKKTLMDAINAGIRAGENIYLVRDPDQFHNTDSYGRELAWLFIGDDPWYDPESFDVTR